MEQNAGEKNTSHLQIFSNRVKWIYKQLADSVKERDPETVLTGKE